MYIDVLKVAHHQCMITEVLDDPDLSQEHSQFLKVDEAINHHVVVIIKEGKVLLYNGREGNEWGFGDALNFTIYGHTVEWIHV